MENILAAPVDAKHSFRYSIPYFRYIDPIRPDSDYGTSKAFREALARQYHELYGIEAICLRIGTVLADDDPRKNKRFLTTWLSHDDLVQLIKKSICAENVKFGIYYGYRPTKEGFGIYPRTGA